MIFSRFLQIFQHEFFQRYIGNNFGYVFRISNAYSWFYIIYLRTPLIKQKNLMESYKEISQYIADWISQASAKDIGEKIRRNPLSSSWKKSWVLLEGFQMETCWWIFETFLAKFFKNVFIRFWKDSFKLQLPYQNFRQLYNSRFLIDMFIFSIMNYNLLRISIFFFVNFWF